MLQADMGVKATQQILEELLRSARERDVRTQASLDAALRQALRSRLAAPPARAALAKPLVILVVGANGSGKTTTVAKLANVFKRQGKSVLVAAADTFRAAATEQLRAWAALIGVSVIAGAPHSDPGAVVFNAVQAAVSRSTDVVLVDTAGRLHTRQNLMEELQKVGRVAGKALPGAPHEVWLVLDATTGQNALQQAYAFKSAVNVSGVILAKLDSSARGGMALAVASELGLPVLFAGLGEGLDDLVPFDPDAFVAGLLA